ncbi:hypothetical protein [Bradyrhizobium acaciae]|uniref:hypothetical protein n=1 Tax=Bradyrhizobium acaciae TaxID=2683706 RepID=UPI001E45CF36|nr:hypothetical protein [Bradyrhizobium acaciae]MCC8979600.1 hypothetical protein [Bradyrhizobium acaciae]
MPAQIPCCFLRANAVRIVLVFVLVSAAIANKSGFKFKWLWLQAIDGQGHQTKDKNSRLQLDSGLCALPRTRNSGQRAGQGRTTERLHESRSVT